MSDKEKKKRHNNILLEILALLLVVLFVVFGLPFLFALTLKYGEMVMKWMGV